MMFCLSPIPTASHGAAYGLRACLFFVVMALGAAACSPKVAPPAASFELEGLSESAASADSILYYLRAQQGLEGEDTQVESLRGRAAARVSMPGSSEQATLEFTSSREESLLRFRNNLGIEGGRIYADADSVLIYDRLDKTAQKMSIERSRYALLNGFTAFNVVTILFPEIQTNPPPDVYEDEQRWVLATKDGRHYEVSKDSALLTRVWNPADDPLAYNQFIFSSHAEMQGVVLPRRIQILSKDEESSIFLTVRALELNPEAPDFDLGLPGDIPIERL